LLEMTRAQQRMMYMMDGAELEYRSSPRVFFLISS